MHDTAWFRRGNGRPSRGRGDRRSEYGKGGGEWLVLMLGKESELSSD